MSTARVERRLSAILAADVVGYSGLMERDEAGTFEHLMRLRRELVEPLLARHGGRFVDLKGDGAIVEFGSVVEAVEAAVAIQRAMQAQDPDLPEDRRIRYRIGINLGDVIVEGDTIYGDGVNVAARIESLCEPGGVWLSRSVYNQVRGKLDLAFAPSGLHQVKNISEAVETFRVALDGVAPGPPRPTTRARMVRWLPYVTVAFAALVLLGGAWRFWPGEPPSKERPGIAVLPFANYGGDEATGRLADGLTEDVITDLARFRDLDVIARNSVETYKGKPVDVRQVGKELNVGYVLEGSVQRQADRVRITTQLIDTASGAHVWSERWDRPAQDVFAVQTELAEAVAARLGGAGLTLATIARSELAKAKRRPPASLSAYEHYLLAAEGKAQSTEEAVRVGLEHAERAIALDPTFARAYAIRGWLHQFSSNHGVDYATALERMGADLRRAVELDPMDADARAGLAQYLAEKGRFGEAAAELGRALDLSPRNSHVLVVAAANLGFIGRPEEGVTAADEALRLDPRMSPANLGAVTWGYFTGRRFARAVDVVQAIPEASRRRGQLFVLAASLALLGREQEMAAARAAFVGRYGEPSAELWLNTGFVVARREERDLFVEAFRKLGLPVCLNSEEAAKLVEPSRLPECVTS